MMMSADVTSITKHYYKPAHSNTSRGQERWKMFKEHNQGAKKTKKVHDCRKSVKKKMPFKEDDGVWLNNIAVPYKVLIGLVVLVVRAIMLN